MPDPMDSYVDLVPVVKDLNKAGIPTSQIRETVSSYGWASLTSSDRVAVNILTLMYCGVGSSLAMIGDHILHHPNNPGGLELAIAALFGAALVASGGGSIRLEENVSAARLILGQYGDLLRPEIKALLQSPTRPRA